MTPQADKGEVFKTLHESGETFIIPNPWDAGSAVRLEKQGFKALATTSSGFAATLGRRDGQVSLDEKLAHCQLLSSVTSIPINADFENGFADAPDEAAANLIKVAKAGVVGASIEDWSGEAIYDFDLALARVTACAAAVKTLDFPFMLTARSEGLLRQVSDLDENIKRLHAFSDAGADVLYVPGLKDADQIRQVMDAVSKPVNVLAPFAPSLTLADYKGLGVARVSIGGALAGHAVQAEKQASEAMLEGRFNW